jgi:hypothetical protein
MHKSRIVIVRVWQARQNTVLEQGKTPKLSRHTRSARYGPVRGTIVSREIGAASRNGPVSDLPPETPKRRDSQLFHRCVTCAASNTSAGAFHGSCMNLVGSRASSGTCIHPHPPPSVAQCLMVRRWRLIGYFPILFFLIRLSV